MSDDIDRPRLTLSTEAMRALGYRVVDHLVERWAGLADARIPPRTSKPVVRARLEEPMPAAGREPGEVIDRVVRDVLADAAPTGHPRFFGFIPSPSNYLAVLADALVAGFNPFGGNFIEAPGPHELERITVDWLRERVGLPRGADGLFVSGGSMANLTALCAARSERLGQDVSGARVYVSDQTHASVAKALSILGFPDEALRVIPSDEAFRMRLDALESALDADRDDRPFCVVATCGTTNTGAVDPLAGIAALCRDRGLWLHVDGAYGAAARLAGARRSTADGLELADSLSLDPHKWLFTPYECGLVLLKDGAALPRTFRRRADYLDDLLSGDVDLQDMGPQLTRSLRALKVWMTVQAFGTDALADAIDAGFDKAEAVEARLQRMDRWEVAAPASMAIVAFRYVPEDPAGADELNLELVPRLAATGEAFVTSTKLRGRRYLRMCTLNPRTTDDDLDRTLTLLDRLARDMEGGA